MRLKSKGVIAVIVLTSAFLFCGRGFAAAPSALRILPEHLTINSFYSGQNVLLFGDLPPNREVFIEIKGPTEKKTFNIKGKIGPLWMNTHKVTVDNVPSLYFLLGPPKRDWHKKAKELGIGLEQIKKTIMLHPEELSRDSIFEHLVRFKGAEQLYSEIDNAIKYSTNEKGQKRFQASFYFPSAVVPADYEILTTFIHNGTKEKTLAQNFRVEEVGMVKLVRRVADQSELLYGLFCVVIALAVGLSIGLIFKGGGGH